MEDNNIIKQIEIKKLLKEYKNLLKVIEIIKKNITEDIIDDIKIESVVITENDLELAGLRKYEQELAFETLEKEELLGGGGWYETDSSDIQEISNGSTVFYDSYVRKEELYKFSKEIKEEYEALKMAYKDLKMAAKRNKNQNLKRISPELIENPPKIVWGNVEILLPVGSKQFDVCKSLFQREKGEIVCWDEIAEEMDDLDIKWRTIYDAVRKVNKKVEEKTELKLFCVKGRTFYRKY